MIAVQNSRWRQALPAAAVLSASWPAMADVNGVWKTQTADDGGYLEVTVGACAADSSKICSTISKAFKKSGEDSGYNNLGKLMIKDMTADDATSFSRGTIRGPEKDKTYSSKMTLKGDELDVEGCVAILCQGQAWKRVK